MMILIFAAELFRTVLLQTNIIKSTIKKIEQQAQRDKCSCASMIITHTSTSANNQTPHLCGFSIVHPWKVTKNLIFSANIQVKPINNWQYTNARCFDVHLHPTSPLSTNLQLVPEVLIIFLALTVLTLHPVQNWLAEAYMERTIPPTITSSSQ
jgi:hypothetical protein